jgi:hypothetical protein
MPPAERTIAMNHHDPPEPEHGNLVLGFAILKAIQAIDAPVRAWDALTAEEQERWAAVARVVRLTVDELPALLDMDAGPCALRSRAELCDLLQCALAYVSNAVSLHTDLSAALYAERRYRCPCGTCHFEGDAQCACYRCRGLQAANASGLGRERPDSVAMFEELWGTARDIFAGVPRDERGIPDLEDLAAAESARAMHNVPPSPRRPAALLDAIAEQLGRAVRDKTLSPDSAVLWLCTESTVTRHHFDQDGNLIAGPRTFIASPGYDELAREEDEEDDDDDILDA